MKSARNSFFRLMQSEDVAGLIVAPVNETKTRGLSDTISKQIPVVVIDRRVQQIQVDTVLVDNLKGAKLAVKHLIGMGYKRIGTICGPQYLTSAQKRYEGYLQALEEAGLPVASELVRFGDFRQNSGYELATELITMSNPPRALFVANNLMTIGALNAIHYSGLKIPHDVSIIGFDDMPWAESLNPPLTNCGATRL